MSYTRSTEASQLLGNFETALNAEYRRGLENGREEIFQERPGKYRIVLVSSTGHKDVKIQRASTAAQAVLMSGTSLFTSDQEVESVIYLGPLDE